MSSFKNFAPLLSSLQDQADGKGTIAGSPLEDFLSIAGYETPGGGGGDSDYSGANITITFEGEWCPLQFACATDNGSIPGGAPDSFVSGDTATIMLYKGKAIAFLSSGTVTSTTGDIEYDADNDWYLVTGDCSIAVTGDIG